MLIILNSIHIQSLKKIPPLVFSLLRSQLWLPTHFKKRVRLINIHDFFLKIVKIFFIFWQISIHKETETR